MQRHGKDRSRKDREQTGYDLPSSGKAGLGLAARRKSLDPRSKGKDWRRFAPRWNRIDLTGRGEARRNADRRGHGIAAASNEARRLRCAANCTDERRHSKAQHGSAAETTRQATQSKGIEQRGKAMRSNGAAEKGEAMIWR